MANEAVIIELLGKDPGRPVRFTCGNISAVVKGALMKISDPRTAAATSADNDPFAGVLAAEEESTSTTCTVYTHGIFDMLNTNDAAVAAGERVSVKAANSFSKVAAADLLFSDIGICLEDAAKQETSAVLIGAMF